MRLLATLLVALSLPILSAGAITLDPFSTDQQVSTNSIATPGFGAVSPAVAVGGARKITATKTAGSIGKVSGESFYDASLPTPIGAYFHSQDAGVSGKTTLTYDGSTNSVFNPIGLGGINFTKDGSTKFRFNVLNFNAPSSGNVTVTFTVYSSLNSGADFASLTKTISSDGIIELAFSEFLIGGNPATPLSFASIGAVKVEILGGPAADLTVDSISTNGECDLIPLSSSQVIVDQCGVCGGDSSSCKDCAGTPNGSALPGTACQTGISGPPNCSTSTWQEVGDSTPIVCNCLPHPQPEICDEIDNNCDGQIDEAFPDKGGACGIGSDGCTAEGVYACNQGGELYCTAQLLQPNVDACNNSRGCDGVPHSGLVVDECGICGGNGTTCKDCAGTIHGTALVDQCGVCGGNGLSCISCTTTVNTPQQAFLDQTAKAQEKVIKVVLKLMARDLGRGHGLGQQIDSWAVQAHFLQDSNWRDSWGLPNKTVLCNNKVQSCITTSNEPLLAIYLGRSKQLRDLMNTILGVYRRKLHDKSFGKYYSRKAERLYKRAQSLVSSFPKTQDSCG